MNEYPADEALRFTLPPELRLTWDAVQARWYGLDARDRPSLATAAAQLLPFTSLRRNDGSWGNLPSLEGLWLTNAVEAEGCNDTAIKRLCSRPRRCDRRSWTKIGDSGRLAKRSGSFVVVARKGSSTICADFSASAPIMAPN